MGAFGSRLPPRRRRHPAVVRPSTHPPSGNGVPSGPPWREICKSRLSCCSCCLAAGSVNFERSDHDSRSPAAGDSGTGSCSDSRAEPSAGTRADPSSEPELEPDDLKRLLRRISRCWSRRLHRAARLSPSTTFGTRTRSSTVSTSRNTWIPTAMALATSTA